MDIGAGTELGDGGAVHVGDTMDGDTGVACVGESGAGDIESVEEKDAGSAGFGACGGDWRTCADDVSDNKGGNIDGGPCVADGGVGFGKGCIGVDNGDGSTGECDAAAHPCAADADECERCPGAGVHDGNGSVDCGNARTCVDDGFAGDMSNGAGVDGSADRGKSAGHPSGDGSVEDARCIGDEEEGSVGCGHTRVGDEGDAGDKGSCADDSDIRGGGVGFAEMNADSGASVR